MVEATREDGWLQEEALRQGEISSDVVKDDRSRSPSSERMEAECGNLATSFSELERTSKGMEMEYKVNKEGVIIDEDEKGKKLFVRDLLQE